MIVGASLSHLCTNRKGGAPAIRWRFRFPTLCTNRKGWGTSFRLWDGCVSYFWLIIGPACVMLPLTSSVSIFSFW